MQDTAGSGWNRDRVVEAILSAGKTALDHFHQPAISMKHDMTIVTEADREIEEGLAKRFARPDEGVYFIGEETIADRGEEYLDDAFAGRAFIVDPIDGTVPFAHGFPTWGISVGYAEDGFFREGALFLPTSGQLLVTEGDTVYYGRLGPIPVDWDADRMVPFHLPEEIDVSHGVVSVSQDVTKRGGFSGKESVHASGSAVFALTHLALGALAGYIASVKVWDIAGGWPIIERLGFHIAFEDGSPATGLSIADAFNLSADSKRRWRAKSRLFVARNSEYVADLRKRTDLG